MAKRTIHMLVDDLDGGDADETLTFALDGSQYQIDLSKKNAAKLRDALARYVAAGTKVGRIAATPAVRRGEPARRGASAAEGRDQNRQIREWAQKKGIAVSDRGRIKQDIVNQFHAEVGS